MSLQVILPVIKETVFDWRAGWRMILALLLVEAGLLLFIIHHVSYTEIDWKAYMDEVEGAINGTYDYVQLKGDTGPLVYPAGFVYVFAVLYYVTEQGTNLLTAQYCFAFLYLVFFLVVAYLYKLSKQPPYLLAIISLTAFRIHSIFVLRLFNDPVAMLIFYTACVFFTLHRWTIGCMFFSFAVAIKMNVLLFAPGLLVLLVLHRGVFGAVVRIILCGIIQLVLAAPFLFTNPIGYVTRAFDLGRQFMYKWTVNWRLVPESIFLDRRFHIALLLLHLTLLFALVWKWTRNIDKAKLGKYKLDPASILFVLFSSNLMGIVTARSLHYQFYVWYYHSIAWILWISRLPTGIRILLLIGIEIAWNTYPSTPESSIVLHICHVFLVWAVFSTKLPVVLKDKET